ncbi:hypothetical protein EG68_12418 [Paragonimus skrjabini miyazakii]|uniref:Transmembrane protein 60 n=1 Tax=Paragonimus skrjabini miyazakii TaxID=59628 RepID=A0A8S9YHH5_9TREM|nr:hypothetical protein EG68_12418 [Paragonimus skrjabini miyazakii]
MMSFNRPMLLWLIICVFLMMVILQLNQTIRWNWFIIFIPMWILDLVMLISVLVCLSQRSVRLTCRCAFETRLDQYFVCCFVMCKLAFQVCICLYAEQPLMEQSINPYPPLVHSFYAIIPYWVAVLVLFGVVSHTLVVGKTRRLWELCCHKQSVRHCDRSSLIS